MIPVATMWDDGLVTDLRLIELLHKLGATANFAIAPGRHGERKPNDERGPYGTLVSASELKHFAPFEISNHTLNHVELPKLSPSEMEREVGDGRKMLEDIFQRHIDGFCYPYGEYNRVAVELLRRDKYAYARTTRTMKSSDCLTLHPDGKWGDYEALLNPAGTVLWGHTYELTDETKWDAVRRMYEALTQDPRVKLVTFTELVAWRNRESLSRVRFC